VSTLFVCNNRVRDCDSRVGLHVHSHSRRCKSQS
jgi:hypothetical protein